jgi:lysine 2,3-aminomutase
MAASKPARSLEQLVAADLIDPASLDSLSAVARRYAIAITPAMIDLVDRHDPADPIARQFVPDGHELDQRPEESEDPIGDDVHSPVPGIVHRYPDRVLLKLLHTCPVYCRFCFRRERVGPKGAGLLSQAQTETALGYIGAHPDIWEVILTGGDPLLLSNRRLAFVLKALGALAHIKVIRLHTRVPAVDPDRVTPALVRTLSGTGKAVYVALHANHPRELTDAVRTACARLVDAGIPMLSQSVLLRGINDDPATLGALMRAFVEMRIKPYYLHHGDLAPGTGHFRTSIEEGEAILRALRGRLSGLCQPAYVLDIPGGFGKVPIGPNYRDSRGRVEDRDGTWHIYPPEGRALKP